MVEAGAAPAKMKKCGRVSFDVVGGPSWTLQASSTYLVFHTGTASRNSSFQDGFHGGVQEIIICGPPTASLTLFSLLLLWLDVVAIAALLDDYSSNMERLQQLMRGMPGGGLGAAGGSDSPTPDCAEKVHVSSLALLKMLKHGRAGVPMEVMGLMLGQFVDDYTINCVDVFAMPQSGTSVSVEAVDPVFQTKMLDMLKQTGRPEMVVGWYHSHPGFGCWLSSTDINTQSSFEALNSRAVALVVDPIQSVKGKVVIDCFRLINPQLMMLGQEPRQTTSNIGHLQKPSIQALIHGLNRHYYSIVIDYRKNELEEQMLMNLHKRNWTSGLTVDRFEDHQKSTEDVVDKMLKLTKDYNERVQQEEGKTMEEIEVENVGKIDPKKHLEASVSDLMSSNIIQCLGTMLDTVVF